MRQLEFIIKIMIGNLLLALSVNIFVLPFDFISGGTTGLGILAKHYWNLNFNTVVLAVNVIMFIIGLIIMGKKFAATTVLSTFIYPALLKVTGLFTTQFTLTHDPLVAALMGGALAGLGLGLVIQSGASTGGMDIPPIVINKYTGLSVAIMMNLADLTELIFQMSFSPLDKIVGGVIMLFTTTFVMNQILTFGHASYQVMIFSEKYEALRTLFLTDLNKGLTLFEVETGYNREGQKAVVSVVSQKDLARVRHCVYSIDKNAFMVVSKVQEVRGENFTDWEKVNHAERFMNS